MSKILGIIVFALIIIGGGYYLMSNNPENSNNSNTSGSNNTNNQTPPPPPPPPPVTLSDHPVATIETSMGAIVVTLDHTTAPKTVENFVKLANEGFYNGLKFHRVIPNFVIQGGDPLGTGAGGPGYTVPAEISLTHKAGAIAMARTGDEVNPARASSGSQFYIVVAENANTKSLDGGYTVFGYVTTGMDVVTKISKVPTEPGDYPLEDIVIKKITIKE